MMICKNISVMDGLCNGTRVQITRICTDNLLECRHIYGPRQGETFLISKTVFENSEGKVGDKETPFKWKRTQFPLRPGFVMTVNKSQGLLI